MIVAAHFLQQAVGEGNDLCVLCQVAVFMGVEPVAVIVGLEVGDEVECGLLYHTAKLHEGKQERVIYAPKLCVGCSGFQQG